MKRLIIVSIVLAALALAGITFVGVRIARHQYAVKPPGPLFILGKDTTGITGPPLPNGRPDYVAALDARLSAGVTAENNAFIPLLQMSGPGLLRPKDLTTEVCRRLGVNLPPAAGPYLMPPPDTGKRDELAEACSGPWAPEQHPKIADWLQKNQVPLDSLIGATTRAACYFPQVSRDAEIPMAGMARVNETTLAVLSRAAVADAMRSLREGRTEKFEARVTSALRLGRLARRGPQFLDGLTGESIEDRANRAILVALGTGRLPVETCRRLLAAERNLAPAPTLADTIDTSMRWGTLDVVLSVAVTSTKPSVFGKDTSVDSTKILWDVVLRRINQRYDALAEVFRVESWPAARTLANAFDKEGTAIQADMEARKTTWFHYGWSDTMETYSERVADFFMPMMATLYLRQSQTEREDALRAEGVKICLALAIYRSDHGALPETLAPLVDAKLIDVIPTDFYSGKPIIYRVTGNGYRLYSVGDNGMDDAGSEERDFVIYPLPVQK